MPCQNCLVKYITLENKVKKITKSKSLIKSKATEIQKTRANNKELLVKHQIDKSKKQNDTNFNKN